MGDGFVKVLCEENIFSRCFHSLYSFFFEGFSGFFTLVHLYLLKFHFYLWLYDSTTFAYVKNFQYYGFTSEY